MTTPTTPTSAPRSGPLKALLAILFFSALIIYGFFSSPPIFTLSRENLSEGRYWTLITYLFSHEPAPFVSFFLRTGFDLLLLWFFGLPVLVRTSQLRFALLFFGSALLAGAAAALALYLFPSHLSLAGPTPSLLAIATAWAILHAGANSRLLPAASTHSVLIFAAIAGLTLLFDLIGQRWLYLTADSIGVACGYFYCIFLERSRSEIPFLFSFEEALLRLLERGRSKPPGNKIVDIQSGQTDDEFMDKMLEKISRKGERSLTSEERSRMERISNKKRPS